MSEKNEKEPYTLKQAIALAVCLIEFEIECPSVKPCPRDWAEDLAAAKKNTQIGARGTHTTAARSVAANAGASAIRAGRQKGRPHRAASPRGESDSIRDFEVSMKRRRKRRQLSVMKALVG
ncbi:MAG: hypothetical protein KDJ52_01335 [Anaerolineae bacterium]|nr:hypothetical protein [Anaerolineae bacterium]